MPKNLKRYYGRGDLHFVTFSCYRRMPLLRTVGGKTEAKDPTCKTRTLKPEGCGTRRWDTQIHSMTNAGGIPRINSDRRANLESQSRTKPRTLKPEGCGTRQVRAYKHYI